MDTPFDIFFLQHNLFLANFATALEFGVWVTIWAAKVLPGFLFRVFIGTPPQPVIRPPSSIPQKQKQRPGCNAQEGRGSPEESLAFVGKVGPGCWELLLNVIIILWLVSLFSVSKCEVQPAIWVKICCFFAKLHTNRLDKLGHQNRSSASRPFQGNH